jgi:hypothetical protein
MNDNERERAEKLAEILQRTDAETLDMLFDEYGSFDILLG